MALVAAVILAAAGIGLGLYRDHNLHHDERMTRRALSAGYVERHAAVGGVTVNYAEGPSDGLALLLILPQTPMRTRCASRPRYRTAGRLWSSQDTTSTRRCPTISRGPSTRRAGRRRHGEYAIVRPPQGGGRPCALQPTRSHPYGSSGPEYSVQQLICLGKVGPAWGGGIRLPAYVLPVPADQDDPVDPSVGADADPTTDFHGT